MTRRFNGPRGRVQVEGAGGTLSSASMSVRTYRESHETMRCMVRVTGLRNNKNKKTPNRNAPRRSVVLEPVSGIGRLDAVETNGLRPHRGRRRLVAGSRRRCAGARIGAGAGAVAGVRTGASAVAERVAARTLPLETGAAGVDERRGNRRHGGRAATVVIGGPVASQCFIEPIASTAAMGVRTGRGHSTR